MIFWFWSAVILIALVLYFRQAYSRFSRYGVKHLRVVPVLGNMTRIVLRKEHLIDLVMKTYDAFPVEKFVGTYQFMTPVVSIKDLELVKKITVKDYEHFIDHNKFFDIDPFIGRNLVALKGQDWKDMRSSLSPAFTSSKMRSMVPFMVEVGEQMIRSLKEMLDSGVDYIDIDIRDLTTRYANDVIASCAFGLKINSHVEKNNQFYEMGSAISTFKFKQTIILFLNASFPKLMNRIDISLFPETINNFFRNLVMDTMKDRETRQIIRPDMIHLLMEAKNGWYHFHSESHVVCEECSTPSFF